MWEIPFLRSGESMVDCRTTPKKNLKEIIFPTTVTFNDMRSKRLFTNDFFSPRMLENVLWTKQVFQYAKVSIWGCHFKRCWFWWQKFLPSHYLFPLLYHSSLFHYYQPLVRSHKQFCQPSWGKRGGSSAERVGNSKTIFVLKIGI